MYDVHLDVHLRFAMSNAYSISDARRSLPQIVHDAESGTELQITRRGQVVAVLIGIRQFELLKAKDQSFMQAYMRFREQVDADMLIPNTGKSILHGLRDTGPGREFSFDE